MIKGPIFQEIITILNVYSPNNRASKYLNQKLRGLQEETDKFIFTVGDVITPLSEIGSTGRHNQ